MYRFKLSTGEIISVKPIHYESFIKKYPDAVYLGGGTTRNPQTFVVDGKTYDVDEANFENFKNVHGNKIETLEQNFNKRAMQLALVQKYSGDPFVAPWKSWSGFMDWWKIDADETQEENSWYETLFGKNQLFDVIGDLNPLGGRAASQGWKKGADITELGLLFKVKDRPLTEEENIELFEAIKRQSELPISDEMIVYLNTRALSSPNQTFNAMDAFAGMSPTLMFETQISSIASSVRGIFEKEGFAWGAAAAGTGAAIGAGSAALAGQLGPQAALPEELATVPIAATIGAFNGLFSGVGGAIEATGKVGELIQKAMQEEGLEFNYENFKKFSNENPEKLKEIRSKAITKGITIAAVDTLFGSIAVPGFKALTAVKGGTNFAKIASKPLVRTGIAFTGDGLSGVTGEYLSQKFIGEEADPKELMLEGIGGGGVTLLSATQQLIKPGKYSVQGAKATREQVWELLSNPKTSDIDITLMDIEVENDAVLQNELKAREKAAVKMATLPKDKNGEHIISKKDRERLLELETSLDDAKDKNAKMVVIDGVAMKVKDVKSEVESIYDSYSGKTGKQDLKTGDVKTAVGVQEKLLEKQIKFAKEKQKGAGLNFDAFDFSDQYKNAVSEKAEQLGVKLDLNNLGEAIKFEDGTIFIDKQRAIETKTYNSVGSHEILHNIVDNRFNNLNTEEKTKLISDFQKTLKSKLNKKTYSKIVNRLKKDYGLSKEEMKTSVEWFNVFSDAVVNDKSFSEKSSIFKSLLSFFNKNVNKHTEYKNLDFGNVKNMYEWLKTYSRDVKAGKDVDVTLDVGGTTQQSRTKLVDDINEMQQGAKTREEFLKPNIFNKIYSSIIKDGGAINNYIKSLRLSPEQTQETIDGVADRLMNFNPAAQRKTDTGAPITLGEFIMANVGFGKLDAAKKLAVEAAKTKQETRIDAAKKTKEGERTFDIEDTDVSEQQDIEEQDISPQAEARRKAKADLDKKPKTSKLRKTLGIETGSEAYNRVLETARKVLIRAYDAGQNVRNIQIALKKEANAYIFKQVKNMLGVGAKYIPTISNLRVEIINSMFTADLVQMERNIPDNEKVFTRLVRKLTKVEDVQNAIDQNLLQPSEINKIKKGQAVNLYEKVTQVEGNKKQQDDFVAFFDQPLKNPITGVRSGLKGTRKDQLTTYLANSLTLDAIMQVAQETNVVEKRQQMAELRGETIDNADIQNLSVVVGRKPNVQFSFTLDGVEVSDGDYNIMAHVTNIFNKVIEKGDIKGIIVVEEDKIYLKNKISRIVGRGDKKMSQKSQDFVARLVYQMYNDNRYARPSSPSYRDSLMARYVKLKQQNKRGSLGIAEQIETENLLKNAFGKMFKFLSGTGDIYAAISGFIYGWEVKLGESQGVSQRVTNTKDGLNFPNKNKTKNEKGKFFDDVIGEKILNVRKDINNFLEMNGFNKVEDFSKPLKQEQIDALYPFRFLFQVKEFVNDKYITSAYAQEDGYHGNTPQGMMISERDVYHMVTGNKKVDELHSNFVNIFNSNPENTNKIPRLELLTDKQVEVTVSFEINKNGTMVHRIRPQLIKKDFKKSSVNINDAKVAKNIGLALEKAALLQAGINQSKAVENARPAVQYSKTSKGMSTFDFDETLIDKGKNFIIAKKDNETIKIKSSEWPIQGPGLAEQGYTFDFSDFVKVRGGIEGPLLQKMRNQIKKFGPNNVFVLTARPPESATAIQGWLKSKGINISLKNITGLGNSTGEAKAMWMLEKFAEGYNDMYFVDDALSNVKAVKNVLDQLDIKSNVQQVRVQFSQTLDNDFNNVLEEVSGIDSKKRFSDAVARKRGRTKGRFRFFVPPSHEDFVGLLYNFIGKGAAGNRHRKFFEDSLIKPLNRAYRELNSAKQAIANDYKKLTKAMPDVRKRLGEKILDGDFTVEDAIRVYLWNKLGVDVPGLSNTDKAQLANFVFEDTKLRNFADVVGQISRMKEGYVEPGDSWEVSNIRYDLVDATGRVGRAKFFTEFQENADIMFSAENINKIRAIYGDNLVEALQDMLYRVKSGTNRPVGKNKQVNAWLDWINGSVGAVMFFNVRSALLQQLSLVNFINFADNNIFKAAAAFANQKQFWADFATIFNSDYLKQRRSGAAFDVNANEIAREVAKSRNPVRAAIKYILNLGFLPTQMGDSFAIAVGGAGFYRNRINTYIKQGFTKAEATEKSFTDFQETAEATQQSARPDMISQQQASVLGRLVLAFQNVTSQYVRLMKKSASDIINRRISPPYTNQQQSDMANISRIMYYGVGQGIIFYGLQQGLFAMMFDDDERDEDFFDIKMERLINGIFDSILKGSGVGGSVLATLKNYGVKLADNEKSKKFYKEPAWIELLQLSPPIGIKVRKLARAEKSLQWNKDAMKEMSLFDIDNPIWEMTTTWIEGLTNIPLARLHRKAQNISSGLDSENAWWQRIAVLAGWSRWDIGIENKSLQEAKQRVKENQKEINKQTKLKKKYPGKTQQEIDILETEKTVYNLNKREQERILKQNGLNPKNYKLEKDRVNAIMKLRNKNKSKIDKQISDIENFKPNKSEQREIDLFKMNKNEQVNLLMNLGLSPSEIKKLKYEEDRVKKIIQLENKSKNR